MYVCLWKGVGVRGREGGGGGIHCMAIHLCPSRMTPRNLAVVLTPSIIRLKARTKLMSPEELRVLPKQTALVEHLICHADRIGSMTPQLRQSTLDMAERRFRKKLGKMKKIKKRKGTWCVDASHCHSSPVYMLYSG